MRLLITSAVLAGCYDPTIPAGAPCEHACPGDLLCIEHRCLPPGGMPPGPDAPALVVDGAIDAVDGPPGDGDADGVLDNADNCPTKTNVDQHDEDGDAIGDVCDPCPHIAGTAADMDGDGVGDACDPQPTIAKQHIKFFDPFTSALPQWALVANASRVGETLRINGLAPDADARLDVANGEVRIETGGTLASISSTAPHQLSIEFGYDSTSTKYHYCEFYDNGGSSGDISITKANGNTFTGLQGTSYTGVLPTGAWSMRIDESVAAQQIKLLAKVGGVSYSELVASTSTAAPSLIASSSIGVYVQHADFRLDYWIVIETLP